MTHHFVFYTESFIHIFFPLLDYYNKIDITKYEEDEKKKQKEKR